MMQISAANSGGVTFDPRQSCLVLLAVEGADPGGLELLTPAGRLMVKALIDRSAFSGKAEEAVYLPEAAGPYAGVLLGGLGPAEAVTAEVLRRVGGKAAPMLAANQLGHVVLADAVDAAGGLPLEAFLEGVVLGQYGFDRYKTQNNHATSAVTRVTIAAEDRDRREALEQRCQRAAVACAGANYARDLACTASNDLTPTALAEAAETLARESGLQCEVLDEARLDELGLRLLLGVGQGSAVPPRLILLEHRHPGAAKTVALVGKGITFDTGGVSIKPSEAMHEMKYDMCGAAAVLGAMQAIARLQPAVNVIGVAPAAENAVDGRAVKPGDILRAYNGKTVELHNTDAEGRLILADALAYTIERYQPDHVVDVATLTGAAIVALGHYAAGLMTGDDGLAESIAAAGEACGERVWRLPMWPEYMRLIEGTHADLCNIGPKGEAGTIVGGCFLSHFAGGASWAHLDIAGTAWGGKHIPYWDANYATGYGVRLLVEWVRGQAA